MSDNGKKNSNRIIIEAEGFSETLRQWFETVPERGFPLTVTGHSMTPFLIEGRDTAVLTPFDGVMKPGEVYLYENNHGKPVLHRFVKEKDGFLIFAGDGNRFADAPVKKESIMACCTSVIRNGKMLKSDDALWKFFSKIWIKTDVKNRRRAVKLYNMARRDKK